MRHITQEAKLLSDGRYSPRELKLILSRKRCKKISTPTWQRWKRELGICPDDNGNYWEEDRVKFEGLIVALKAGWTIAQYKQFLENQKNAVEGMERPTTPIEVEATVC